LKKIILNNKGQLVNQDKMYFGGKYSLLERIRMGGIGSAKVIYKSGVPYFDEIAFVENEITFANFEILKNGLLIRVYRNLKFRYIGFQLHEILKIKILEDAGDENTLQIFTLNDDVITFEVNKHYKTAIKSFFKKKMFEEKFEFGLTT
jgi:hypothetical protein